MSYSGGKDSTVLLDIVRKMYPDVPAVFSDTGLEYPEVRELALRNADVVVRPGMTFKDVIERYGYPVPSKEQANFIHEARHTKSEKLLSIRLNGKTPGNPRTNFGKISDRWKKLLDAPFEVSGRCCDVIKKKPLADYQKRSGRYPMIATMASESMQREKMYLRDGCQVFDGKKPRSTPMAIWTDQDVLRYIIDNGIEYAGCYGEIAEDESGLYCSREDRTGCMFCMFGIQFDGEPNRFQRMERDYPKQYDYCINKLGIGEVLDYIGIPYVYQPTLMEA